MSAPSLPTLSPERQAKFDATLKANASRSKALQQDMPFGVHEQARSELQSGAVQVKGIVIVAESRKETVIRFENLAVPFFPDLVVALAADPQGTDAVDFLELRAIKGHVNHMKRGSIDLQKYPYVLIRSKEYGVVFGYALLLK